MGLLPVLLLGFMLALILVKMGKSWRSAPDRIESYRGWANFLSLGLGGFSGLALLSLVLFGDMGSMVTLLLLPRLCALWGESILFLAAVGARWVSRQSLPDLRGPALGFLIALGLLMGMGLAGEVYILWALLFGGAILAAAEWIWAQKNMWQALAYWLVLGLLLSAVWQTDRWDKFVYLPGVLASLAQSIAWLAPGLGVVSALQILGRGLADEQRSILRRLSPVVLLIVPICLLIAWQAATASAWDVATDGLGGIFMLQLAYVLGGAAAIQQAWRLPGKQHAAVFGGTFLVLVVISGANAFGTYGSDGEWGNVPHKRTERRAEMINQAILHYYKNQGSYPQALTELSPGYLLYLPTPFIIPGQDWCYQGGQDFYRLGYVYRDYFSTPASVKVHAAVRQPPDPAWPCEAEAAKYPGPSGFYDP